MTREVLAIINPFRADAVTTAELVKKGLAEYGITLTEDLTATEVELVLVFGGDGTLLRAAETARKIDVPLLGVNIGHMGFLAEAELDSLEQLIACVAAQQYQVEERMTLQIEVSAPNQPSISDWALNEVSIMHTDLAHPAHFGVGVDGHGVSTYGADGILVATPTGSTAYSFSAGGPVIWPDAEAFLMVPLAAHGLFTRPLVLGPSAKLEISVLEEQRADLEIWCDGIRSYTVPAGTEVVCTKSETPVKLARLNDTPFSARLVAKFNLPVDGWRNR